MNALAAPGLVSRAEAAHPCAHCGAAIETPSAEYCCGGCEAAASIIRGAGLERYYAEREAMPPRPGAPVRGWSGVPTEKHPDGSCSVRLQVDGITCASCVWVTERVLEATPGIREVSVSYATGRALLRWDPEKTDLETLCGRISTLGYRPRPIDAAPTWDRDLLVRLGVAVFCAMNTMMLAVSVYLGWWEGMDERFIVLFRWAQLALATPVALWSAVPFFQAAWEGLKHRALHMDLPVSLGIAVLYGHGLVATFLGQDAYLDSMTMLVALLLMGRVLEQRGRARAAAAAASLAAVVPQEVRRVTGETMETVHPEDLEVGDRVLVAAGEEVGADGLVEKGEGSVRMALLTGESEPVRVKVGDRVVAGAALLDGSLQVRVEAVAAESLVGRMARGLLAAGDRPMEPSLPDRIAPWFTAITLVLATGTFAAWNLTKGLDSALHATVAVLVVACPCALALAAPLAASAGLGAAARRGLLLRGGDALRRLATVREVALDKTGTLTGGELELEDVDVLDNEILFEGTEKTVDVGPEVAQKTDVSVRSGECTDMSVNRERDRVLWIAAALERESIHPVARALVAEAIRSGIPLAEATDVEETAGEGISGTLQGVRYSVGRGEGAGEVSLWREGRRMAVLRLRDRLRPDAARTVATLKGLGLRVVMLSGDHQEVAERVGAAAGVDEVVAQLRPEDKAVWLRSRRLPTLFVGDGLNDGPALRAATVGIAMARGAASSLLVADGVVAAEALGPVAAGLRAAHFSALAVQGNLRRSLGYNLLAVSAAAAGLVNPLVAAVLMPLSSSLVIWGASRIERRIAAEEIA